jgi:hypothetical protein
MVHPGINTNRMPPVRIQATLASRPHDRQYVVHDPLAVPDPKNSAFFPNKMHGHNVPKQPTKYIKNNNLSN